MLTVAIPKRNKLQNIIVLTPKDGKKGVKIAVQMIGPIGKRAIYSHANRMIG